MAVKNDPLKPADLKIPGLGNLSAGQQASINTTSSSGSTFFKDPNLASAMSHLLGSVAGEAGTSYMDFLNNPTGSPLYTNALAGLANKMAPSERDARMNLGDTFRAAGNTSSSTFADKAMGLESNILGNRQTMASDLLTKLFPQMADALYKPLGQIPSLLEANKLQQNQQTGSQVSGGVTGSTGAGGAAGVAPGGPAHFTNVPGSFSMTTTAPTLGMRNYLYSNPFPQ